jgi:SecD/SecF fusion protein
MPTKYTGRIVLIVTVVLVALVCLFPPDRLFDSNLRWGQKLNLKPGIDMVGGTSLLYEIRPPEGEDYPGDLSTRVMDALKKRVDPEGVKNLVWRPQGPTRLEIQMPASGQTAEAAKIRDEYASAQQALEATNVRLSAVTRAVETLQGDARAEALKQLAGDSERRGVIFGAMRSTWDQIQAARQQENAALQAEKEIEYEKLKDQVLETNLTVSELELALSQNEQNRSARLEEFRKQAEDFPSRLAAIDRYVKAHDEYQKVKDVIGAAADLKRLLRGSGVLEFHILVTDMNSPEAQEMVRRLHERGPRPQAGDTMKWFEVDRPQDFAYPTVDYNDKQWVLGYITPDKSMVNRPGQPRWALKSASRQTSQTGLSVVSFSFDNQGAQYFGELTGANLNQPLAIVLDDKELEYLVKTLNAGSLPAQLNDEPISERTVGPQLGQDNLRRGLFACVFGLFVVAVFLIGYYYFSGVVAMVAVLLNMLFILGAMAAIDATFTLPGIAGIILTIGMAVDANVLIFERLREEQVRGLSLRMALRNAYDRAWSAILDSNITTGITALALYLLGSEEVKGFGLTLLLGIVSSMFTALFVTKTIFGMMLDRGMLRKLGSLPLTFPRWDQALRPNVDWMSKAKYAYAFSTIFIVLGLVAFGVKLFQGKMFDIEFSKGTAVQFELKEPMEIDQVRKLIERKSAEAPTALPSPSLYSINASKTTYEVVTPNDKASEVREAIVAALGDRLDVKVPSSFDHKQEPVDLAMANDIVQPVESIEQSFDGFNPPSLGSHLGGVAITLKNLDPPLTPEEIKARIEAQRLDPSSGGATQPFRDIDVEAETGPGVPAKTAIVLVSDPNYIYDPDPFKAEQWTQELAAPMWELVNGAITRQADLQKVVNFSPQVAGKMQQDALIAMFVSVLAIVAYIWFRFGDLRYGTATVLALLHDTLFTIGAIGLAHYLAATTVGDFLLIEPFRINLTMVAAILTVMGYSMNDTVVVFDRIRENRGKYGAASRQVINDSINQTLSRTLLTGGTTIVTIFVMYITGGSGIHGFTFALLVGILVGTYSSIAIAAPLLLIGKQSTVASPKTQVGPVQRVGA